jgi:membrane protein DedA with SNARE-associated domain
MNPAASHPERNARPLLRVILLALLVPVVPFVVLGELPGERWLSAGDANALAFGAIGGGLLAVDVLLPIPSTLVGTLLGARLGFAPGWLWGWGGLVLGNLAGYAAGRLLLARPDVAFSERPTAALLFVTRPVPVLAEALVIAAGAGRLPWRTFLMVSVLANGIFAGILAGNGAAWLPEGWTGPGLLLPLLLPVAAWGLWRLYARRRRAPASEAP